jgi:hypothetical protein
MFYNFLEFHNSDVVMGHTVICLENDDFLSLCIRIFSGPHPSSWFRHCWKQIALLLCVASNHVQELRLHMGFKAVIAANIKIMIIWDVIQSDLVDGYQYFRGICCLHLQGRMETEGLFKTVLLYWVTWR